jgi:hypothetical protein
MIAGAQQVTISGTSAKNATAFADSTRVISIYSDTDCHIEIGTSSVVATTSDHFIPAQTYMYLSITLHGDVAFTHIAVIQASAGGTLYISEFQ